MTLVDKIPVLGNHIIIECYGKQSHMSVHDLEALMRKAASAAGATVLGCNIHAFGPGCGNTGVLLLAESHISVHTWPEHNYAAFDIFMCGNETPLQQVIDVITRYDVSSTCHVKCVKRGLGGPLMGDVNSMAKELMQLSPSLKDNIIERTGAQNDGQAFAAVTEVVKFLILCSSSQARCVPSKKVDNAWHECILFTQSYAMFCQKYLARFIHHTPSDKTVRHNDYADYQATLIRYQNRFGQPCHEFWPDAEEYLSACGACST